MVPSPLPGISSLAWEHPADRAALNTLRAIPGFDEVVRKIAGFFGERGVRHLFLANAVRVGPRQRPALDTLFNEVVSTFDWPRQPQLYVTQTPFVNAGAVGFDEPFIIMNSGTLGLLSREEQRDVLAHELGHIMSGHVTYSTIALILLNFGLKNLPFLAGMALLPIQIGLLEWYRKSELSCDRAGLLGTQNVRVSLGTYLKLAGGAAGDDTIDLDDFLVQAQEYETTGGAWDSALKLLNTVFRDHPFNTVRAAELQRWAASDDYARILRGDYPRRGQEGDQPLGHDYAAAAGYYGGRARAALTELEGVVGRARDAFGQAFRGGGAAGGGGGASGGGGGGDADSGGGSAAPGGGSSS
jgi:Zn-dependent protease with chaperone function